MPWCLLKLQSNTDRQIFMEYCVVNRDAARMTGTVLPLPRSSSSAVVVVVVAVAWLGLRSTSACYSYPDGVADPCATRRCSYGARCRPSLDGLTARCQCPDRCDRYGDTVDAGERCGDDGRDYASDCDMRITACRELREIRSKYDGRCGQYTHSMVLYVRETLHIQTPCFSAVCVEVQTIKFLYFFRFFAKIRKICIVGIGKTSIGNESGSVERSAGMSACRTGFSATADRMM